MKYDVLVKLKNEKVPAVYDCVDGVEWDNYFFIVHINKEQSWSRGFNRWDVLEYTMTKHTDGTE